MKFGKKEAILAAVVVALCGLAVFMNLRKSPADQNFPEGTWWICTNKDCKHEFNLTIQQVSDHHKSNYGQPIPCPKCKSRALRGDKCLHCGKPFMARMTDIKCPHCGKENVTPPPTP